jgi:UDP-N-acetylmuramyl pentapeptide phosphotransferase/UDP-N-acetylglucosamine-1-phosphate transferase
MLDTSTPFVTAATLILIPITAGLMTAGLIAFLLPSLTAHALAQPGPRSSHRAPIPQGGGAAVIGATLAVAWTAIWLTGSTREADQFAFATASAILLAAVGAVDDVRGLEPWPKLLLQCVAVGFVIAMLPTEARTVPMLPLWLERILLFLGGVWFVNLTNFMDGIDWMTVAETLPITAGVATLGLIGAVPALPMLAALALLGGSLGFAPFNKPVATLFLGDVGSLPIGLMLGWLLLEVAISGHLAAAAILPLYYLADATLTVARRAFAREPVWQAHRTHFYQRATDNGFTVCEIVARVFAVNLALVALALATTVVPGRLVSLLTFAIAAALVGWLLAHFSRGRT